MTSLVSVTFPTPRPRPTNRLPRGFRLDPIAKPAQRAVGGERRAEARAERVEGRVTVGAMYDRLDLRAVLVVVGERRERHLRFTRLAVAQDRKASSGHALGNTSSAQDCRGQRREARVQRGEGGFANGRPASSELSSQPAGRSRKGIARISMDGAGEAPVGRMFSAAPGFSVPPRHGLSVTASTKAPTSRRSTTGLPMFCVPSSRPEGSSSFAP